MEFTVSIRLARAADAIKLPEVERSAGEAFRALPDLAWIADDHIEPAEAYLPLIAAGTVWVAETADSMIAGVLLAEAAADALHIAELSVAIAFQQRGIGRRLLDAALAWARAKTLSALTLTTFRHVPWNAPFYTRYGFRELTGSACDARLVQILRGETERGLTNRCAMRLEMLEI